MERLVSDLRLAVRLLARSPAFTVVAVASLALGIGANTTIFSLLNALLLRPLPGREPSRLATVYTSDFSGPLYGTSSWPDYLEFRSQSRSFEGLAAFSVQPVVLTDRGESRRGVGQFVSGNFFEVLGLGSTFGRVLLPAEDDPGAPPAAVLSEACWRSRFGADPSIVGREIALNGRPFTIVGVGPAGFPGMLRGMSADLFVPLAMRPGGAGDALDERGNRNLLIFGRLRAGASVEEASVELAVVARRLHAAYPDQWTDRLDQPRTVSVLPEDASRVLPMVRGPVAAFLAVLLASVSGVLLIACTNVANLLLARASARRREIAVRMALGATRGQLLRQMLAESLVMAVVSGALGIALAAFCQRLILGFQPPLPVTLALGLDLDLRVLLFALLLSLLTAVLFGLWPALRATRARPVESLTARALEPVARSRFAARSVLVVAQVAGSLVLLVAAGVLLRSLANAREIDAGFEPEGALAFSIDLDALEYDAPRGSRLYEEIQERLERVPGVDAVAVASALPLALGGERRGLQVEGYTPGPGEDMEVHSSIVGPGYFRAMRTSLVRGREFRAQDATETAGVVVVNEAFVRRYWPGRDGLGERLIGWDDRRGAERPFTVVGVARDGKYTSLGEEPTPFVFYAHRQVYEGEMTVVVRAQGDLSALSATLRHEVAGLDATLPVYDVKTLAAHLGTALFPARAAATLVGLSGSLALLLAALGLYGVLSYTVALRRREIGVRVALGAQRRDVVSLVVGKGLRLAGLGAGLGLAAAFGLTRFLAFLLYGVSAIDPLVFVGVPALLLGVAAAAAWEPARRALNIDPAVSLRDE